MTDLNDEYVTSYEASQILEMKANTFTKQHLRGALKFEPVGRFGTHWIWRRIDVEKYVKRMEQ